MSEKIIKNLICITLSVCLLIGMCISVNAAENTVTIVFGYDELNDLLANAKAVYWYNGSSYSCDEIVDYSSNVSLGYPYYQYRSSLSVFDYCTLELVMPYEATALSSSITLVTETNLANSTPFACGFTDLNNLPFAFTLVSNSSFSNGLSSFYMNNFSWSGNLDVSGLYVDMRSYSGYQSYNSLGISYLSLTYTESEFAEIEKQLEETNTKLQKINDHMGVMTYVMGQLNEELKEEINKQTEQDKEYYESVTTPTDEDKTKLDDQQQAFDDVQSKADEIQGVLDDVEKPSEEEIDEILDNFIDSYDPSSFSAILGGFFGIQFYMTIVIGSTTISLLAFILFRKRG